MVNHTATWLKPGGRLTRGADRRRLLRHAAGTVIRPATTRRRARPARAWTARPGPRSTAPRRRRRPTARSSSTACSSPSSRTGSPATSSSARSLPIPASAHVLEIKGLSVSPAHRRRGVGQGADPRRDRAGRGRRRAPAHAARARPQHRRPRPLRGLRLRDRGRPARALPARRPLRRRRADGAPARLTVASLPTAGPNVSPPPRWKDRRAVNQLWEGTRLNETFYGGAGRRHRRARRCRAGVGRHHGHDRPTA